MRIGTFASLVMMAGSFLGCGSAPSPPPEVMQAPHRGTVVRLPGDKGVVELVNEPEVQSRGGREPTAVVAYFLKPDGRSPLEPSPSNVQFVLSRPGKKDSEVIPLTAEPKADDPAGGSRFASKPGPHELATLRGNLTAKIDGQEVSVPVSGGR